MEGAPNPHDVEELLRRADSRGDLLDDPLPGLRQRRDERRDHADHRHPTAAVQLRRLIRPYNLPGCRPAAVDLCARAQFGCNEAPSARLLASKREIS